jgi:hypothetical protein
MLAPNLMPPSVPTCSLAGYCSWHLGSCPFLTSNLNELDFNVTSTILPFQIRTLLRQKHCSIHCLATYDVRNELRKRTRPDFQQRVSVPFSLSFTTLVYIRASQRLIDTDYYQKCILPVGSRRTVLETTILSP